MEDLLNNVSEGFIKEQGDECGDITCDSCTYETGLMQIKSAVFKVNMQGGYFMYDGEGGPISKCPCCEKDSLFIDN